MIRARWSALLLGAGGGILHAQQPAVNFSAHVLPIFEKHCMDCHQAPRMVDGEMKKPKGGVRLDGARAIAMGGENGAMILPGNHKESRLFEVISLSPDDPDIMPPKGDPLTRQEQFLIAKWIHEGAKFQNWRGSEEGLPELAPSAPGNPLQAENDVFALVGGGESVTRLAKAGATVTPVIRGSNRLVVEFASQSVLVNDASVSGIGEMASQIVQLNLSRSKITDTAMEEIGKLQDLEWLNLGGTGITDKGVAHLKGMAKLRYLNLYGTQVSDQALPHLAMCRSLEEIYLWQTRVTDVGVGKLKAALPDVKIVTE